MEAPTAGTGGTRNESKYERLRKIGIGSYGVVFKCVNRQTGQVVAIKRYSENDSDPIIRRIAMREVRMLRQLKHSNLIQLIEVFRRKRRLHLVFDYCELTVLDVIERYNQNCPLNLIKKIIWQLVNGVSYCHQHNCIHRDIKPENILINQAGVVKLCDFGFARAIQSAGSTVTSSGQPTFANPQLEREARLLGWVPTSGKENGWRQTDAFSSSSSSSVVVVGERQALTEYVATRWYRAPELLVGEAYYDIKIDIWAIGCVTAELMRGEPVWPGKTDLDQLYMIKSSLGQLTSSQTHRLLTRNLYDPAKVERLLNQPATPGDSLERKLPVRVGQPAVEFVLGCLQMDPARRPTSEQLLRHNYIHSARMAQFVKGAASAAAGTRSTGFGESAPADSTPVTTGGSATATAAVHRPDGTFNKSGGQLIGSSLRSNSQALLMAANNMNDNFGGSPSKTTGKPTNKRPPVAATATNSTTAKISSSGSSSKQAEAAHREIKLPVEAANNNVNKLAYKRRRQASGGRKWSTPTSSGQELAPTRASLLPISERNRTTTSNKPDVTVLRVKQVQDNPTTTTTTTTTTRKSNSKRRQPQSSSGFPAFKSASSWSAAPSTSPSGLSSKQQQAARRTSKPTPANGLFSLNEEEQQQHEDNHPDFDEQETPPVGRRSKQPSVQPRLSGEGDPSVGPTSKAAATCNTLSPSSSSSTNTTSSSSSLSFLPRAS